VFGRRLDSAKRAFVDTVFNFRLPQNQGITCLPAKLSIFKGRSYYYKVLYPNRMQRKGHNPTSSHSLPVQSVHSQGLACCFPELASGRIDVD